MKNPYYNLRDKELRKAQRAFRRAVTYHQLGEWHEFLVKYSDHIELTLKQEREAYKVIAARGKELNKRLNRLEKDMKNAK